MSLHHIPPGVRRVHLIAACGTGMGALAAALSETGIAVTGSDAGVYPPMSTFLQSRGIRLIEGFSPENLAYGPDLVVVGNAVKKDNPEAVRTIELGLPYCSMPEAINHFLAAGRRSVVVCGTHGKTTTASLMAWVLQAAGHDPSFMIGGILNNFGANYQVGNGVWVVIEGDEYDTAFFDKGPKFMHYRPDIAVLTSVEFDHADIFRDLDHVRAAFDRYLAAIPEDGLLIAHGQDANVAGLLPGRACRIETYGTGGSCRWQAAARTAKSPWNRFSVSNDGKPFGEFRMRLIGAHNRLNALSVVAVAASIGIDPQTIAGALETFAGIKRRQEIRGVKNGVTVVDDFAHHPTAVKETVSAVKSFYPDNRLIAVFEPRTNTSMRRVFQAVYPESFGGADLICIRKPPLLHKVPEKEQFSSENLAAELQKKGKDARFFPDTETILDFVATCARPGDIVLVMSNGGFDNIHERLLEIL